MQAPVLYQHLRAADDAVAKVLRLSDTAQIARTEVRLRQFLEVAWNRHARKAIKAAVAAAKAGKGAKAITTIVDKEMEQWARTVLPTVRKEIDRMYRSARKGGWKKATGQTSASLAYDTPNATELQKAKPKPGFDVQPSFDLADDAAIDAMEGHQNFWIGEHYGANVGQSVAETTSQAMLQAGGDRAAAGKLLESALAKELGQVRAPGGFHGSTAQYMEGVAANAATTARAAGQLNSIEQAQVTTYTIVNPQDSRTCPVCSHMNGKVFTTEQGRKTMDAILSAEDADGVKKAQPWKDPSTGKRLTIEGLKKTSPTAGKASKDEAAALTKAGFNLPPFHFRCRCAVDIEVG